MEVPAAEDPEDRPTDLWAPSALTLFAETQGSRENEVAEKGSSARGEAWGPDSRGAGPAPTVGPRQTAGEAAAPGAVEKVPDAHVAGEPATVQGAAGEESPLHLADTVEVSGPEAAAAAALARSSPEWAVDSNQTMVVKLSEKECLDHECRVCGRKVTAPRRVRFRGPAGGTRGLRCEACSNVVCAAHATRVSGVLETVLRGGRFRCVLCVPSGADLRRGE
jgi:hypothetical protein